MRTLDAPALDLEQLASFYDDRYEAEYMASHEGLEKLRVRKTLEAIQLPDGATILDYGCGRGAWAKLLHVVFPQARLVGIEISPTAVERARLDHPGDEFLVFAGGQAPLPDESCDLVFSYHVLEHVRDLRESVADMARLVRPGGYICAILPCANRGSIEEIATRLVRDGVALSATGERRFFHEDPGHLRRLTSDDLTERFREQGCDLTRALYLRWWASLSYLASQPGILRRTFAPRRARNLGAAVLLAGARAGVMFLAAVLRARRVKALRPLARPLAHMFEVTLPRREWRRSAAEPHRGAAQYLVFRRA